MGVKKTAADAVEADVEKDGITELASFEPTRVDGVHTPANGFPILMMKSIETEVVTTPAAACACGDGCVCGTAKAKAKKAKKHGGGRKAEKGATIPDSGANTSSTADTDVITKAVAKALAASEERIKTLETDLAKVLATPIPGGPLLVTPLTQRPAAQPGLAKAERLRAVAAQTSDPETKRSYIELAVREEGAPIT
jgi:hypothetical protein